MKKIKYFFYFLIFSSVIGNAQKPLLQIIKNIGGQAGDTGDPIIAIDNSGNIYTTSHFGGTIDFNPGVGINNITSIGSNDVYISKLDSLGNLIWVKNFGGTGNTYSHGISLDGNGNIYISGYFSSTTDFDPNIGVTNLTSLGGNDAFVSKLDGNGNLIWTKSISGTGEELGQSISIDPSGNITATGTYSGTTDFDPSISLFNLTSVGASDIFILKLDAAGNFVWAKSIGGNSNEFPGAMTTDALGNTYTTGQYESTVDFNPGPNVFNLTSAGVEDIFVLKLDGNGNFIWAKTIGGTTTDIAYSIKTDALGKVYTTGYYSGTVDFDPNIGTTNLTSVGGSHDIFALKLDSIGNFIWAKSMGGNALDYGKTLGLDNASSLYISGLYNGTGDFDPGSGVSNLIPNGNFDVFILKLDSLGNFIWAKNIGGTAMEYATALTLDKYNSIFTVGKFENTVDFDPNSGVKNVTSLGSQDAFIHKMIQCNLKSMSGFVSGSSSGNMVLYQYIPTLSKWDSVAFTPYSASYSFGLIDSSSYVLKAVPTATNEQVTYFGNAISWQGATVVAHGCMSNTTNTIAISSFTNIGSGTGSMSGHIIETNGFGHKPNSSEFTPTVPGNPIGGIVVKGGRNPGGQMFTQTTTDPLTGAYTLSGIPDGTNYFILVDIPGLDTNLTYHRDLSAGNNQITGLDFTVDSIFVNPIPNMVGIKELSIQDNQIMIYPNPTYNQLNINYNLNENSKVSIELFDIAGKLVKTLLPLTSQTADKHKNNFLLTNIDLGIYFIKLKINNKETVVKLFITI